MKYLLIILFLVNVSINSFAAKEKLNIDSLQKRCNLPVDNPEKSLTKLRDTIFFFFDNNIKKAGKLLPYAEYFSDKINTNTSRGIYFQVLAYYKYYSSQQDSAVFYLDKALSFFLKDSVENMDYITASYNALALMYDAIGMYKISLVNHLKAIKTAEQYLQTPGGNKMKLRRFLAAAYSDIAQTYSEIDDSVNAEKYFKKSIDYAEEYKIKDLIITNKFNYAVWLTARKEYSLALPIFKKTDDYLLKTDTATLLVVYFNEAEIYYRYLKQYDKALELARKIYNIALTSGFSANMNDVLLLFSNIYYEMGEIDNAIKYCSEYYKNAEKHHNPKEEKTGLFTLAKLYKKKKDFAHACDFQSRYIKITDSLFNSETQEKINSLKLKFKLQNQITENKLLQALNTMKDNKLKRQITKTRIMLYVTFGFSLFLIFLFLYYKKVKQHNRKLEELNNELTANKRDLQKLYDTQKNLFAILSHDLKGPIGTTKSFFDILTDESVEISDKERDEYIRIISKTINSTYELLENVLYWSKSRMSNSKLEYEVFSPHEIVEEILKNIHSTLFTKEIEIKNLINPEIKINYCIGIFKVIVRNLITNAIKYTNRKGKIEIFLEEEKEQYVLCVKDNGIGMSAEKAASLFDKKVKSSTPGTEKEKGSGLGLMISSELIRTLGGEIWVKSKPGEGSVFCFSVKKQ